MMLEVLLIQIQENIHHFVGLGGGKGAPNCERKSCEQADVSYHLADVSDFLFFCSGVGDCEEALGQQVAGVGGAKYLFSGTETLTKISLGKQGSTPTPWARGLRDQIQKWVPQTHKTLYF